MRKQLDIEFEGYTWPERFLVITTKFDFAAALGCCSRNYMAGDGEWTNLFKVAGDDLQGRWRAVYNTREDESDEEALSGAAVRARLSRVFVPEAARHLHLTSTRAPAGVRQSPRASCSCAAPRRTSQPRRLGPTVAHSLLSFNQLTQIN